MYSTTNASEYLVLTATEDFFNYPPSNLAADAMLYDDGANSLTSLPPIGTILKLQNLAIHGHLLNKSLEDCTNLYAPLSLDRYSNVILMRSSNNPRNPEYPTCLMNLSNADSPINTSCTHVSPLLSARTQLPFYPTGDSAGATCNSVFQTATEIGFCHFTGTTSN